MLGSRMSRTLASLALVALGCSPAPAPRPQPPTSVVVPAPAATIATDGDSPTPEPESIVGRWQGIGVQDDGSSWQMRVTIRGTRAGPCATVEYPTIACAADWICEDGTGELLRAREQLTDGHDRCIDGGAIEMRVDPSGLLEWRYTGGGVSARASLRRQE